MTQQDRPPINWPATLMFILTTLPVLFVLPWYLWEFDVSAAAWVAAGLLWMATGMAITAGYHRLWAHKAYKAHPIAKWALAIFGGMALQNSILIWATGHRSHHRHVDHKDKDPYSAERGFWFSHMGWMIRKYPSSDLDYHGMPDLVSDPVVMTQHRHYLWFALVPNFVIPMGLGLAFGDFWGFVLIAGFLRIVVSHHATFFINSLAHMWGRQPYTTENSARDNDLLALFTWGEGYHNYHHIFQYDYRNGIRWWQFDPTKWSIWGMSKLGLTSDLKRVPEIKIEQARVNRELERMNEALQARESHSLIADWRHQIDAEWVQFKGTLAQWADLQKSRIEAAREQVQETWEHSDIKSRIDAIDIEKALREQRMRVRALYREFQLATA
ncbi:acyl-CoA desaturase [Allohahella sp. A8]|uniref:acyl-CoA desaturase n=1 Tax=Allohahella sp. A8 TaxID=3141461 RepID=UPI000C0B413A|nr:acyl-CoA desaturase [Hahellaceae bacterium]